MDTLLTPYFDKPEIEFMGPGVRPSKAGLGSANAKKKKKLKTCRIPLEGKDWSPSYLFFLYLYTSRV
jgi:hypothetical protein